MRRENGKRVLLAKRKQGRSVKMMLASGEQIGEAEAGAIGEDDAGAIGEVEADPIGDEEVASSGERTAAGSDTPVATRVWVR